MKTALFERLEEVRRTTLDVLFPRWCLGCGSRENGEFRGMLCSACIAGIERLSPAVCGLCQANWAASDLGALCEGCASEGWSITHVRSVFSYVSGGPLALAIIAYKHGRRLLLEEDFMPLAAIEFQRFVEAFRPGVIHPVPLHRSRLRWRGFNQAERLAQIFAGPGQGALIRTDRLSRVRDTRTQADLNAGERVANVQGAFSATAVPGERWLLVDDVMTTGSTLEAAARAARSAGASEVAVWTLARARRGALS